MDVWILGLIIFFVRIIDVSLGTIRTISIVQGRMVGAFVTGLFEISMWLLVITAVLQKIIENPFLAIFYAFGFSTGNVIGILLEKKLAMGYTNLRIISSKKGKIISELINEKGYGATTFEGEGKDGKVIEVYVVCERKSLPALIKIIKEIEPDAFYITEQVGIISKMLRPMMVPATGWRAIHKKK
jgi:uncharacterized protein YebE (UPF0316 family)